jgi:hypothetical protein
MKRRALIFKEYMCVTLQFNFCKFRANWPYSSFLTINTHVDNALTQKALAFIGGVRALKITANC